MIFKIKKGRHYSDGFIYKLLNLFHTNDRLSFSVIFNETSLYTDETLDRFDVNKLFGFSKGLHHNNSYRFGWNCLDNKIHIYSYSYIDGVRTIEEICVIDIDQAYKFIIRINNGKVIFSVIDGNYAIKQSVISINKNKVIGYNLWPYFGGNKTAPRNISIELI